MMSEYQFFSRFRLEPFIPNDTRTSGRLDIWGKGDNATIQGYLYTNRWKNGTTSYGNFSVYKIDDHFNVIHLGDRKELGSALKLFMKAIRKEMKS